MLRHGTAYADLRGDPAVFELVVRALAEGNSLRATARILHIDKDTACAWLDLRFLPSIAPRGADALAELACHRMPTR